MAVADIKRKRVLFVDDEPAFLETVAAVIEATQSERWEAYFAESAGQALSILQDHPVNLVVIDIEMPVIDGLQFLSLVHRKHPNLSKVVLTGYATDQHRAACLSGGAELFLEKPRTAEDLQSILATLHELARLQPEEGFRGVLRRVGLTDIIQMECLSRHSVMLCVASQADHGEIYIKEGAIVHARAGDRKGEAAFHHLLSLKGGEFDLRPYAEPSEQTIEGQWEFLLMEAARQMDEQAEAASQTSGPSTSETGVPVEEGAEAALLGSLSDLLEPERVGEVPAGAPPATSAAVQVAAPAQELDRPTRVDEILLCSPQGEVIYEWQCQDVGGRINFLEFLSQKSRQIGAPLDFGVFDRLEVLTPQAKVVAQLQPDCGVFVRTSRPSPSPANDAGRSLRRATS